MKALLMKDMYVFWRRMKLFALLVVIFAAISSTFQNTFAIFYAAMVPYSLFSVDETSKWDKLAAMLPYSTFELVASKYLLGGIATGCCTALVLAFRSIAALVSGAEGLTPWLVIFMSAFGAVLIMDITLPLVFRYGVEKARMTMLFLLAAVCGGAGAMAALTNEVMPFDFSLPAAVLPLAAVVATVVSVKASMRNYEKRER